MFLDCGGEAQTSEPIREIIIKALSNGSVLRRVVQVMGSERGWKVVVAMMYWMVDGILDGGWNDRHGFEKSSVGTMVCWGNEH
jgi:hypothetical protein